MMNLRHYLFIELYIDYLYRTARQHAIMRQGKKSRPTAAIMRAKCRRFAARAEAAPLPREIRCRACRSFRWRAAAGRDARLRRFVDAFAATLHTI